MMHRSITLVGEKGRKILKDVVKQAKCPPKTRSISQDIINKFKSRIDGFSTEIAEIVRQEAEEKEVVGVVNSIHLVFLYMAR